jgi:hypothetical protein
MLVPVLNRFSPLIVPVDMSVDVIYAGTVVESFFPPNGTSRYERRCNIRWYRRWIVLFPLIVPVDMSIDVIYAGTVVESLIVPVDMSIGVIYAGTVVE